MGDHGNHGIGAAQPSLRWLNRELSTEIATAYRVPSKKVMGSWIASLNHVRNVSAHHARLFNRKLVAAPSRPRSGQVPVHDHLRDESLFQKVYGMYNALAVMAYLLDVVEPHNDWRGRAVQLIQAFPSSNHVTDGSIGVPANWTELRLWRS